jgi:hypothetical protein
MFPNTDKVVQLIPKFTFNELLKVVVLDTYNVPSAFKFVPTVPEPDTNNDEPVIL